MGDLEGNPWLQPANGLQDSEGDIAFFNDPYIMPPENSLRGPENDTAFFTNPYMMQLENDLRNPQDDANFNEIFPNMHMIQDAVGLNGTPRTFSNNINNLVANGNESRGYTYANIPSGVALEEIPALATPPFQVEGSSIEPQYLQGNTILAEKCQDELEYASHAITPQITKRARKNSGPSSEEWQKWKPEIYRLYVENNYTLNLTMKEMARKGFYAESVTLPVFFPGIIC
jgi:hypothetical protein